MQTDDALPREIGRGAFVQRSSFQADVQVPPSRTLSPMVTMAIPSSARAARSGPTSTGVKPMASMSEMTSRFASGETVVEAGPGDYVLLDGTLPHDAEVIGRRPARLLIVYPRGGHSELTRTD